MTVSATRPMAAGHGGTASSPWADNAAQSKVGLDAETVACRCGRAHQPRERKVPCRRCNWPTEDIHALCGACQLIDAPP